MDPHDVNEVVISAEKIKERVRLLVEEMQADCQVENLVMIGILRGSFIFLADMARELYEHGVRPKIDFMTLASYHGGTESSGKVVLRKDFTVDVEGADVVVMDDILDTGRTFEFARNHIADKGAKSIRLCTFLDKPSRRIVPIKSDYVGFTVEDIFVVGYGLDYDHHYRELPYVAKVNFTEEKSDGSV